jgi:hypothetical protein
MDFAGASPAIPGPPDTGRGRTRGPRRGSPRSPSGSGELPGPRERPDVPVLRAWEAIDAQVREVPDQVFARLSLADDREDPREPVRVGGREMDRVVRSERDARRVDPVGIHGEARQKRIEHGAEVRGPQGLVAKLGAALGEGNGVLDRRGDPAGGLCRPPPERGHVPRLVARHALRRQRAAAHGDHEGVKPRRDAPPGQVDDDPKRPALANLDLEPVLLRGVRVREFAPLAKELLEGLPGLPGEGPVEDAVGRERRAGLGVPRPQRLREPRLEPLEIPVLACRQGPGAKQESQDSRGHAPGS